MPRRAERIGLALAVLLLHALLLWVWPRAQAPRATARPEPNTVAVTLLPLPLPPPPMQPAALEPAAAAAPAPTRAPRPRQTPQRAAPSSIAIVEPPQAPGSLLEAAQPAASSAAPSALKLTLPSGALREAQGSMRHQVMNDPRSNIKPDPTQVLPNAVAASAKGDCLKGEYFGGGMGLLSAPFLAYAAVAGDCKPQR